MSGTPTPDGGGGTGGGAGGTGGAGAGGSGGGLDPDGSIGNPDSGQPDGGPTDPDGGPDTDGGTIGQGPYQYVTPDDVGVLVGAGSNGRPTPSGTFGGGSINSPTVIENKIVTGAVSIQSDDVVFRNVHFRNDARTMLSVSDGVDGLTIENSTVECTANPSESASKQVLVGEDLTNLTVRTTEFTGCSRLFILDGDIDGFVWENNVRHQAGAGFEPNGHSVGLHIAYFTTTTGAMAIRGSYFEQNNTTSYTDQISMGFSGHSRVNLTIEDSYFHQNTNYTIRCTANTDCTIRRTVFSNAVGTAAQFESGEARFECNRRPNGNLVGNGALIGGTANNNNCPNFP